MDSLESDPPAPGYGLGVRELVTDLLRGAKAVDPRGGRVVIECLASSAAALLETAFRVDAAITDTLLSPHAYRDLTSMILHQGRDEAGATTIEDGVLRLINYSHSCPMVMWLGANPHACDLAACMLGSIAARNFGYAKVSISKRALSACEECEFRVHLDAGRSVHIPGQEYHSAAAYGLAIPAASAGLAGMARPQARRPPAGHGEAGGPAMVARSPAMARVLEAIRRIAPTSATVLVTGETGVGKELVARTVHAWSARCRGPFVAVNCGAIPETLVESALFGHERGAFTGANERRSGFFERAENGTLFLDEIDSLSASAQTRLLRVLQEGEFERVGGQQVLHTNARIVAASNRNLDAAVGRGGLREDLYYRINIANIYIPPLRERRDDLPPLVHSILDRLCARYQRPRVAISGRVMAQLLAHEWPGNVRELENLLERSLLFCDTHTLDRLVLNATGIEAADSDAPLVDAVWKTYRRCVVEREERKFLEEGLRRHGGDVTALAESAGISRRAVYQKLQQFGINPADFRAPGSGTPPGTPS